MPTTFVPSFKGLRKASRPEKRLAVRLNKARYEFIQVTARRAGVTPSQVLVAALAYAMYRRQEEWLPSAGRIARHLKKEGMTLAQIARALNLHHSRTKQGTLWQADTVLRLLQRGGDGPTRSKKR